MARPAEHSPTEYTAREVGWASAMYRALKQLKGPLVQGLPSDGEVTLVDGRFDLREVARAILAETDSRIPRQI
jgi:hypothetical protein